MLVATVPPRQSPHGRPGASARASLLPNGHSLQAQSELTQIAKTAIQAYEARPMDADISSEPKADTLFRKRQAMLTSSMESFCNEFFGGSQQQDLQHRADLVWALVKDDPSYACHGRAVALASATDENIDAQIALARLQGVCAVKGVSFDATLARREALEQSG